MHVNSPVDVSQIRRTIIETAASCGESAHIGGSLSMVELLNVLFGSVLRHTPKNPNWDQRDIFILSKGHAVLGYFATLHAYGYFDDTKLATFQQNGSDLIAHPVKNIDLGIESSNGSLGQGLSYGLGIALGMNKRKQNRRVFVLMGDGECNEGSVWEAAALASELGLVNLIAIVDENGFRNDGSNTMYSKGPVIADVWQSFGWNVLTIDGHNTEAIEQAYAAALDYQDGPSVIVAKTIKGKGISFMEANNDWHHNRITAKTLKNCADELGFGLNDA